jgi:hypothetical protein
MGSLRSAVVLLLLGLATLTVVQVSGPQDWTRLELTRSIALLGSLQIPADLPIDKALYGGRTYADKAPGMSVIAIPAFELERALGVAKPRSKWDAKGDLSVWGLRLGAGGLLFLLAVWLVMRAAGTAAGATFGAGTLASPLAATMFAHVGAGGLGLGAFLLARRPTARRSAAAGFVGGCAVLIDYPAAVIVVAVAVVVALRAPRRLGWFVLGGLPPLAGLLVYNAVAFGSPFHLSYRYEAPPFSEEQHHGFFGVGVPTLHGLKEVLVGDRGLLVYSPVLVLAAVGLWLLWREGRRLDAGIAAAITVVFVLSNAGYFLPYGGASPGPRFLVAALPFLALGLGPAFRHWPRTTTAVAAISVVLTTADLLTYALRNPNDTWYPGKGESDLAKTIWVWLGLDRTEGGALVLLCSLAALATATWPLVRSHNHWRRPPGAPARDAEGSVRRQ